MGFKIPNFAKQMGGSPFQISYDVLMMRKVTALKTQSKK